MRADQLVSDVHGHTRGYPGTACSSAIRWPMHVAGAQRASVMALSGQLRSAVTACASSSPNTSSARYQA
jgi:hypothetical protein